MAIPTYSKAAFIRKSGITNIADLHRYHTLALLFPVYGSFYGFIPIKYITDQITTIMTPAGKNSIVALRLALNLVDKTETFVWLLKHLSLSYHISK